MKNILKIGVVASVLLTMASCSISGPVLLTDNENTKRGEASYSVILGIFRPMEADISIAKAAQNGGIKKVASVDYKVESKLFKTTYTTVVTGN